MIIYLDNEEKNESFEDEFDDDDEFDSKEEKKSSFSDLKSMGKEE